MCASCVRTLIFSLCCLVGHLSVDYKSNYPIVALCDSIAIWRYCCLSTVSIYPSSLRFGRQNGERKATRAARCHRTCSSQCKFVSLGVISDATMSLVLLNREKRQIILVEVHLILFSGFFSCFSYFSLLFTQLRALHNTTNKIKFKTKRFTKQMRETGEKEKIAKIKVAQKANILLCWDSKRNWTELWKKSNKKKFAQNTKASLSLGRATAEGARHEREKCVLLYTITFTIHWSVCCSCRRRNAGDGKNVSPLVSLNSEFESKTGETVAAATAVWSTFRRFHYSSLRFPAAAHSRETLSRARER